VKGWVIPLFGSSYGHSMWRLTGTSWRQWFMDAGAWAIALVAAAVLRYDFVLTRIDLGTLAAVIAVVCVVQWLVGIWGWLYQGRYWGGSLEEVRALGWVLGLETLVLGTVFVFIALPLGLPRSLVFLAAPMAFCLMLCIRYVRRLVRERAHQASAVGGRHTLIYGAGSLGTITVQRMIMDARAPYQPVGFLDDDEAKANLSYRGIRVLGGLGDLAEVAKETHATVLIVAIADITPKLMSRVMALATPLEMDVKLVPTLEKTLGRQAVIGEVRDIGVEDLIERPPVTLDLESIAKYLSGKRVLVTGAGGSIGQELCAQIKKYGPSKLIMLDHDETHLQDTEFTLWGTGLLMRPEIVLADIRDKSALTRVFNEWKPDVVFHAAALKHVPMLQRHPEEAWNTNVIGTLNVLECARAVGTGVFVNISTDKAANPTTVLGHSKRLAECLTSWMGEQTGKRYCSVRFGNVFGSRGSMVPLFKKMIDRGGPITVTHEDATRYFMTIPEACQLVVQAGAIGTGGDVLILDMGTPVRVMDIVQKLIDISGKDCPVEITGMREGEKINEVLFSGEEKTHLTVLPNGTKRAAVPPLDPAKLHRDAWLADMAEGTSEDPSQAVPWDEAVEAELNDPALDVPQG